MNASPEDMIMVRMRAIVIFIIIQQLVSASNLNDLGTFHTMNTKIMNNKFISVHAACSKSMLLAVVMMNDPFYGAIYSRGYPLECRVHGNGSTELRISIGINECGTRVIEEDDGSLGYENYLYIQYDRQVQQASDEQILVRCAPEVREIVVTGSMGSPVADNSSRSSMIIEEINDARKLSTSVKSTSTVESWMDIMKGRMPLVKPIINYVNMGEEISMLIKIRHKAGVDTKVTSCFAHDGSKSVIQKLTDENGCSVDRSVLADLVEKVSSRRSIKVVHTTFPAFKFPDRTHLHLQCRVIVCNFTCPVKPCRKSRPVSTSKVRKGRANSYAGTVVETQSISKIIEDIDVFNSIEVRALPGGDMKEALKKPKNPRSLNPFGAMDDDEFLCLSTVRVMFVVLTILAFLTVFLVITICMCVRARKLRRRLAQRMGFAANFPYGRVVEF